MIDSQVLLSNQQLETAKINSKTKMLDVYSKMLLADTSKMDDAEKARRAKALSRMEAILFPEEASGIVNSQAHVLISSISKQLLTILFVYSLTS